MKLYYSINSPFARKVRIAAIEKGLMERITPILTNPLENPLELLRLNPLAKVPALATPHGTLCDSTLICQYLDRLSPHNPLIPNGDGAWQRVMGTATLANGLMDAAVALVMQSRLPVTQRAPYWQERHQQAIKRTLAHLNKNLPAAHYADFGSISLGAALGYLLFRFPSNEWQKEYPALRVWYGEFAKRDSMQQTKPQE